MEDLIIEGTKSIPAVVFKTDGNLKMEGRALPEDSKLLFDPIFNWLDQLEVEKIEFNVKLDYFNTAVSKQLYDMFEKIASKESFKEVNIIWHYEEGDDDCFESGMLYKEKFPGLNFEFSVYVEI